MRERSLKEIADLVQGELVGDGDTVIRGACGIREALPGDVTFLSNPKYLPQLKDTRAAAVITGRDTDWREKPAVRVDNPSLAFLKVLEIWKPAPAREKGAHPRAIVSPKAQVAPDAYIGPGAVIEDGCRIGAASVIHANSFIGRDTQIGRDVIIYPNVTVRENTRIDDRVILHPGVVIGADGFGYESIDGKHIKMPQVGNVWIEEDVEIGANACVDRARFGTTRIKKGTKIDNLVQIAHNVTIGEHCLIISQVGVSGSARIGDRVILAGQVGVTGHIEVGEGSIIGAQSGVFTGVPPNSILLGSPPLPIREEKERIVYNLRLPQLFKEVKEIKKKIEDKGA